MKRTTWSTGLHVSTGGTGVVSHAGSIALRLLAEVESTDVVCDLVDDVRVVRT